MKAVDLVLGFSFNDKTAANGWGQMEAANWQAQIDAYNDLGQFSNAAPKLDEIITMEILEATSDVRPKIG
jgi:NitT/TauT family transport system substrate-binding protein